MRHLREMALLGETAPAIWRQQRHWKAMRRRNPAFMSNRERCEVNRVLAKRRLDEAVRNCETEKARATIRAMRQNPPCQK